MTWYDKTYVIVPIGDITQEMVNECVQTSLDTLRKNEAGTEAILKWYSRNDIPTLIAALDPQPIEYTNTEINAILNDPQNDWIIEEEE